MSTKKVTKKRLLEMASELGIKNAAKLNKTALIHEIQITEGNIACYQKVVDCSVSPCLYRAECQ
ncbi:MAG: Rho termination factor N-terminal domain-containing protein [Mariprofundus sp.]|nr:Rho termination factor N-terminal domain-containing protein [Mariprofundus sp.]